MAGQDNRCFVLRHVMKTVSGLVKILEQANEETRKIRKRGKRENKEQVK